ncbi:hypothetical protein CEXT_687921 [Caerostris extrusa]|uniref:Uncharacterized protein n=1 Tax=Caerostris extrusa TaxID=172846 RepID=A0AAV4QT64_CAEEX|nr:hypothetical protein CEXT_687921 [Caerostris extrusa]
MSVLQNQTSHQFVALPLYTCIHHSQTEYICIRQLAEYICICICQRVTSKGFFPAEVGNKKRIRILRNYSFKNKIYIFEVQSWKLTVCGLLGTTFWTAVKLKATKSRRLSTCSFAPGFNPGEGFKSPLLPSTLNGDTTRLFGETLSEKMPRASIIVLLDT